MMIRVGLTGGIGAGKTAACKIFKALGVAVFNSDEEAKTLMAIDPDVKSKLVSALGADIYSENGQLNKTRMSALVFNDDQVRKKVNSIVHPAVRKRFDAWCGIHSDHKYILQEAAILFESGAARFLDKIIVVSAAESTRITRIIHRDKKDRDEVLKIIKSQWTDEERIKKADYILFNDTRDLLTPQVLKIHGELNA